MSEPRTVLITDDFLPHIGGSRVYYDSVARILAGELAVVTRTRPDAGAFDAGVTYPITRTPLAPRECGNVGAAAELGDILSLTRAAAAAHPRAMSYLAGEVNPSGFAAAWLSWRRQVPFGVILHDEPMAGAGRLERALRRKVLCAARVVIAASSFAESRAQEVTGNGVPVFYAPPGVDFDVFTPGAPDMAVLRRQGISMTGYLLCVGRLVPYKNVRKVIEAVADLGPAGPRLVVAGEGPERAMLEKTASDVGVSEKVIFAGRVDTPVLVEVYRGALAYVFPSLPSRGVQHEGIGMGVLEAAACGCPAIVSTATSAADFAQDGSTGISFDPSDGGSLAGAVRRLLGDGRLRESISRAALEQVKARHSWQRTADSVRTAVNAMLDAAAKS